MASKETIITAAMMVLITYTLGLSLVSQAFPEGQKTASFSNSGTIQIQTSAGLGVYSDYQGNNELTSLPWGTLSPGGSNSITIYVKNEGSSDTTLSLVVENWSSTAAETYLDVDWNYNGAPISPNNTVAISLTLSVSSNIVGVETFSFDVIIMG